MAEDQSSPTIFDRVVEVASKAKALWVVLAFTVGLMTQAGTNIVAFYRLPSEVSLIKERQSEVETMLTVDAANLTKIENRVEQHRERIDNLLRDLAELEREQEAAIRKLERLDERTAR